MSQLSLSSAGSLHSIRRLLPSASFVGCGDLLFQSVCSHSKKCEPGSLFAVISGDQEKGQDFIEEAISRGAFGILTSVPLVGIEVPQCVVSDVRRSYAWLCQYLAKQPANSLDVVGITGTNGKTTISWMLRSILNAASKKTGLLGTIQYDDSATPPCPSTMTTPDASLLAEWFLRMKNASASHAVIEVSSHAIDQMRIAGVGLKAAVISNISHDHLDYHRDMKSYMLSKSMIQDFCRDDAELIINGDDPQIDEALRMRHPNPNLKPFTVGFSERNQAQITIFEQTAYNSRIEINCENQRWEMTVPLPGKFNAHNAALAATTAWKLGCSQQSIITGIEKGRLPAGRMEQVSAGQNFDCFIDYAHTPDAIENVLNSLKPYVAGRLICLFGAGGNRDRKKRPLMAAATGQADLVVLTSDNSRGEPTEQIFDDICAGFPESSGADLLEQDRATAIQWAIDHAMPGDCVLILGKGHETGQETDGQVTPFDDRKQVQISLNRLLANRQLSPEYKKSA